MRTVGDANALPGDRVQTHGSGMLQATLRLLLLIALGSSLLVPLAIRFRQISAKFSVAERMRSGNFWSARYVVEILLIICVAVVFTVAVRYVLRRLKPFLDASAIAQARFLDTLNPEYVDIAIVSSAALSLFLELALIRWHSSVLEFLAFYKNFSLLACFAGLGLGYALANRSRILLPLLIPLIAWQFVFMMMIKRVPDAFEIIPFREQLSMGIASGTDLARIVMLYLLLIVIFLLTALTFLPVGQLCGRLMERCGKLRAYGLNLLGSVIGVLLMLGASFLWASPLIWFTVCFLAILLFTPRNPTAMFVGIGFTAACVVILSWWPIDRVWNRVYSPYQLLEIGASPEDGLTMVRAAGLYYQRVHDFSGQPLPAKLIPVRDYYDFPYKVQTRLNDVAVVGAGTGNDVAASLRAGAGRVDAVEIDPAIALIGRENHPEKPYSSPHTSLIIDDARSFLRRTPRRYDLIAYGLLDSHTLLTQGSSVRLDSFVYTVEGLREARNRLKPDGMISLSYSVLSCELGHKIYLMLREVFDGRPPAVIMAGYDNSIIFLESNNPNWQLSATLLKQSGFKDQANRFADPSLRADVSTDDWPFFYMPQRVYPVSYLVMIALILCLSLLLVGHYFCETPRFSQMSFFWLGVGFMLIETKNITEMGLTFGNTWQVIGIVITGILVMAFLGNYAVERMNIRRPYVWFLFLWATLALGWFVARSGGFPSTMAGRLETAVLLASPFLFSGIVFSSLLSSAAEQISGAMAMNLLGAIFGGLVEYNSMYFGFRSLYAVAITGYVLAFLSHLAVSRSGRPALAV